MFIVIALAVFVVVALAVFVIASLMDERSSKARLLRERLSTVQKSGTEREPIQELALLRITQEALELAIGQVRAGNRVGDVSATVQEYGESNGYSVVREFVGHGIGRQLHEDPQVPNYGERGHGPVLKPGMVLAVEPMLNEGVAATRVLDDKWTAVTADGSYSAHFEHCVAVTKNGPMILTQ